jgi:hypothetical protein
MSGLEWSFKGAPLPIPGLTVLGCKYEGWQDAAKTKPRFSFELLTRKRVGDLCGERHPSANEVSWYSANFSCSHGAEWPNRLVCWAYLEAPTCAVRGVCPMPATSGDGPNPYYQTLGCR